MKFKYKRLVTTIAVLVLLLIETVLFSYAWFNYFSKVPSAKFIAFQGKGNIAIIGIYIILMYLINKALSGYKVGYLRISEVCLSQFIAIVCANIIEYAELCIVIYNFIPPQYMIVLTLIEIIIVFVWAYTFRVIYLAMYPPHQMIFVYGDRVQSELIEKINIRKDKYHIQGKISIKEGFDAIIKAIDSYDSVILGDIPSNMRNDILKYCYDGGKRVYVTPKISDIVIRGSEPITLFDTPLLLSRSNGLSGEQLLVKRTMDIIISLILLIILAPFMLITAILIKVTDGGPVFYFQDRYTRDGKIFKIYKFRSMRVAKEGDEEHITTKNDDRITAVGKFIRKIHFDEIPQLINILKGDMSFVGPRPEWTFTTDKYCELIPEFKFRLKVKAGLTGYAQVYGKYSTTPYDKLKLDLTYIENYSLILDIRIIIMTLKTIFQKENSEGVDASQKTAIKEEDNEK